MAKYNIEEVIEAVKKFDLGCGIYNSRNIVGDEMETVYSKDGVTIDACYNWDYIEVFGLTDEDFKQVLAAIKS